MAFTRANLICIVKSGGTGTGLWFYDSGSDGLTAVETNGYMDAADDVMLTGDVLIASMSNQTSIYKVTRTSGDIALGSPLAVTS